jgi:hypothetical protein
MEYLACQRELKARTEEAAMLRSEVKDLKELIELENILNEKDDVVICQPELQNNQSTDKTR